MRHLNRLVGLALLLALAINVQPALAEKGLFWKAQSDQGTAYLLGAIHFGKDAYYPLPERIMSAYESSPVLLVEMDDQRIPVEEQQRIIMETVAYPPGETLQDHVSPETLAVIKKRLQETGMPMAAVQQFRPGFVALMLSSMQAMQLGYQPEKGIDAHFLSITRGSKPVLQIETFAEQMAFINAIPEDDAALRESFEQMEEAEQMWQEMEAAWLQGDADELYRVAIADPLKQYPEAEPVYDVLFYGRNPVMADAVDDCVKTHQTCFVVVGAGHLVGERSVVEYLEKQGYRVEQR